jgi:polysaccharide biosynthesis/export protein
MKRLQFIGLAIITISLLLSSVSPVFADDYKIGPEDVLTITFWQDPTLNQNVVVRQDGKITLSVIGEIIAAGMTPSDLANKIGDRVSRYNKNVSQATVEVISYGSQKIFVTGQVMNPGKFAFEVMPDVWKLIKEAGGITEFGDLSNVVIIRGSVDKGDIINVNLADLIAQGDPSKYPILHANDIVEVKRSSSGTGTGLPTQTMDKRKNIIYVIGRVSSPGPINFEEGMEALDAISLARGPLPDADLGKITIFNKRDQYSNVVTLDIEKRAKKGTPARYKLRPEDTIYLPRDDGGFWGTWGRVRDFVAIFGTLVSTYLLVDRISN